MSTHKRNTSGLKPFQKGYDARREGNGRKPFADLREVLQGAITTGDIADMLKAELAKGNIRALQEVLKISGFYDVATLQVENKIAGGCITFKHTTSGGDEEDVLHAQELMRKTREEESRWNF
jgi:hypothetical protein